MTLQQAYNILGASSGMALADIERVYRRQCQKLQRQLIPGQPVSLRQVAQKNLAQLTSAWEMVKKTASRTTRPKPTKPTPLPSRPHRTSRGWKTNRVPLSNRSLAVSFTIVILMIMVLCFATSSDSPKTVKQASVPLATLTPIPVAKPKPGFLRVWSAPWCQVELDGQSLGPSGQANPFKITAGRYMLTLKRNQKKLTRAIHITSGQHVLVKVQFDRQIIEVDYD